MFKKISLAIVAVALLTTCSYASDDLMADLENGNTASIVDASASIEDVNLDGLDVDSLAANAGGKNDEALEACFRRFNYCSYNYGHYNSCYSYCYRPCYSYTYCYRPVVYTYCYRPVVHYSYCYPTYSSYWGCY